LNAIPFIIAAAAILFFFFAEVGAGLEGPILRMKNNKLLTRKAPFDRLLWSGSNVDFRSTATYEKFGRRSLQW
jgi:hypothetical protein